MHRDADKGHIYIYTPSCSIFHSADILACALYGDTSPISRPSTPASSSASSSTIMSDASPRLMTPPLPGAADSLTAPRGEMPSVSTNVTRNLGCSSSRTQAARCRQRWRPVQCVVLCGEVLCCVEGWAQAIVNDVYRKGPRQVGKGQHY